MTKASSWQREQPEREIDPRFWEDCGEYMSSDLELEIRAQSEQAEALRKAELKQSRQLTDKLLAIERVLICPTSRTREKTQALARLVQAQGSRPLPTQRWEYGAIGSIARRLWNGDIKPLAAVGQAENWFNKHLPPGATTLRTVKERTRR